MGASEHTGSDVGAIAHVRCYAELNDFLSEDRRGRPFPVHVSRGATLHSVLATLSVPSDQVDMVLVNGESAELAVPLAGGDRVSVYPVFESFDVTRIAKVHPRPLRKIRFVLDTHLGKLTSFLRMLGFDSLYRNDYRNEELLRLSVTESRTLLTRSRRLLQNEAVSRGYRVDSGDPRVQVAEVVGRFDLAGSALPFSRCLRCNGPLESVSKEEIIDRLLPETRLRCNEFRRCPHCDGIYWRGAHFARMQALVDDILARGSP